jgi:hypothetical protein
MLGVGRGANDPNSEKTYCYETTEEAKPSQGCSASQEEKESNYMYHVL